MDDKGNSKKLGRMKMLVCYHHINQVGLYLAVLRNTDPNRFRDFYQDGWQ